MFHSFILSDVGVLLHFLIIYYISNDWIEYQFPEMLLKEATIISFSDPYLRIMTTFYLLVEQPVIRLKL